MGGGWQEGVNKATTRPRRWALIYDESVRPMVMAVTKRARMARAMVMAMSRGGIDKNLRKIICPKINFEVWKL